MPPPSLLLLPRPRPPRSPPPLLFQAATFLLFAAAAAFNPNLQGSSSRPPRYRALASSSASASQQDDATATPAACRPRTATGRPVRSILVLGDGDFSFSAAIRPRLPPGASLTTSCYHGSRGELTGRYPAAAANLRALESAPDATVVFGVDVTTDLAAAFPAWEGRQDRVVFNLPHVVGKANIAKNRELLAAFFGNAARLLTTTTAAGDGVGGGREEGESGDGGGGGEVLVALCRGQSGVEARDARAYKASWHLALAAAAAGLTVVGAEPFHDSASLYRPSGHRDKGSSASGGRSSDEDDGGDTPGQSTTPYASFYVYHTRDPRIYTLVPASDLVSLLDAADADAKQQQLQLRPVAGPVFAHELHLWCHASLLNEEEDGGKGGDGLEARLHAAVLRCWEMEEDDGMTTPLLPPALRAKARECLASLRFVERYRPNTSSSSTTTTTSSSPSLASYPEARAYELRYAWRRGGALSRSEADALREAVEGGIERAMDGLAALRKGKGGFGVRDVTYQGLEGLGGWGD